MKQIYNEGRVVGLSAHELYVRQMLSTDPEATILDERHWLSAALSANCSMILKVSAGTSPGYHDYILPEGSDLCGCSVINGTLFEGKVTLQDEFWACRVDDYGRLISNTHESHPVTPGTSEYVPAKPDPGVIPEDYATQCKEYMKVTGALMIQPGTWESNIYYEHLLTEMRENLLTEDRQFLLTPMNDFETDVSLTPDLSKRGFVRLAIAEQIEHDFCIIFTGFSYKTIVYGQISYDSIYSQPVPEDGDFLGPAMFPWACKINLNVSNDVLRVMIDDLKQGGNNG